MANTYNSYGLYSANLLGTTSNSFVIANDSTNYLTIAGSTTGNPLTLTAGGTDTNISINLVPKGSGTLLVNGSEVSGSGGIYMSFLFG